MDFILNILGYSADEILEIYSIGGAPYLITVLQGVSNMVYSRDFNLLLAIVALVGFLILLGQGAANPKKFNYMWLFILAGIYYGAILPRTDVRVADTVMSGYSEIVKDVPLVIALPAAFFSNVSLWFTREVETQFSIPSELSYSNSGFSLGQQLIADLQTLRFPDQRVADNYAEFWRTCIFYDVALGRYPWERLVDASKEGGLELVTFIGNHTSKARQFSYTPPSGDSYITPCNVGWTGPMAQDLYEQRVKMFRIKQHYYFSRKGPVDVQYVDDETGELITQYAAAMPSALSFYTSISQSATQIANTAILGNSLRDGLGSIGGSADVKAATEEYSLSKAQLERSNSFAVMGRVASKFLPVLRNVFEALAYAVAPIVILMMVLPVAGKVFIGYMKVLAWINLWNPFYALLHCIMAFYSSNETQGLTTADNGGNIINSLSFLNYTQLSQTMNEHALLAGYLSLSVPMMAWMVVSMSGAMMAGLAARTMQGYDGSVQRASSEITSGNINMGNLRYSKNDVMQDQLAPTTDSHRVSWFDPTTSSTQTLDASGRSTHEMSTSSLPTKVDLQSTASKALSQNLSEAETAKDSASNRRSEAISSVLENVDRFSHDVNSGVAVGDVFQSGEATALNQSAMTLENKARTWAENHGVSKSDVQSSAEKLGWSIGGGLNFAKFAHLSGSKGYENVDMLSKQEQKALAVMKQFGENEVFQDSVQKVVSGAQNFAAAYNSQTGDAYSGGLNSSLSELKSADKSYDVAHEKVLKAEESVQHQQAHQASISQDGTQGWMNYAGENGYPRANFLEDVRLSNAGDHGATMRLQESANNYVRSKMDLDGPGKEAMFGQVEDRYQSDLQDHNHEGGEAVVRQQAGAGAARVKNAAAEAGLDITGVSVRNHAEDHKHSSHTNTIEHGEAVDERAKAVTGERSVENTDSTLIRANRATERGSYSPERSVVDIILDKKD